MGLPMLKRTNADASAPIAGLRVSKQQLRDHDAATGDHDGDETTGGWLSQMMRSVVGTPTPWHQRTPKGRGWGVRGGGDTVVVQPALEWRGTTVQLCGLWPFAAGSALPPIGTPLGTHLLTGATVCADPMSWFTAAMTTTPSAFVIGRPAVGKSTLIRRQLVGMADRGIIPMVLGDTKPDYVVLIRELGGHMVRIGKVDTNLDTGETTYGHINPLDLIGSHGHLADLPAAVRPWAREHLITQQSTVLRGLLEIANQGEPLPGELASLLRTALMYLQVDDQGNPLPGPAPTIRDVLALFETETPPQVLVNKVIADDVDDFRRITRPLRLLLMALLSDGMFGPIFDGPTEHLDITRPGGFDISAVDDDGPTQAAVQLACWAYGNASIALATRMADIGVGPRRRYVLVMDELWKLLRASDTLVYRVDKLTRLNRELGVGQIMASHTMNDLRLATEELTRVAWGFVERSAMVFLGGLVDREFGNLKEVFSLSQREQGFITDWAQEGTVDPTTGRSPGPRGRGKFMLKLGKQPGIPFQVVLTDRERYANDTNRRWAELAQTNPDQEVA